MASNNFFVDLEKILNEKIPHDILKILDGCYFDSAISLSSITSSTIDEIEQYVNENTDVVKNTSYEGVLPFKLKPGHKSFLLQLPIRLKESNFDNKGHGDFSRILKTFIETAENNFGRHPNGFRYDEINRHFSTFVYLMCGKACYEALSANLPIPTANTIRKF